MTRIHNIPYDQLKIGQTATYSKCVTERDIQLFAAASGDINPLHLDADYAAGTPFGERIAHGMLTGGFISAALAMAMPGPGTVYLSQNLRFRAPVKIGDTIEVELEVSDKSERRHTVTLECRARNQAGKLVVSGTAEVMAPTEPMTVTCPTLPDFGA
jgi:3-hydroxybutyryl-CoA dehydratase